MVVDVVVVVVCCRRSGFHQCMTLPEKKKIVASAYAALCLTFELYGTVFLRIPLKLFQYLCDRLGFFIEPSDMKK